MLRLAKEMAQASAEGNKLGLSDEELAFYDALTSGKQFFMDGLMVAEDSAKFEK